VHVPLQTVRVAARRHRRRVHAPSGHLRGEAFIACAAQRHGSAAGGRLSRTRAAQRHNRLEVLFLHTMRQQPCSCAPRQSRQGASGAVCRTSTSCWACPKRRRWPDALHADPLAVQDRALAARWCTRIVRNADHAEVCGGGRSVVAMCAACWLGRSGHLRNCLGTSLSCQSSTTPVHARRVVPGRHRLARAVKRRRNVGIAAVKHGQHLAALKPRLPVRVGTGDVPKQLPGVRFLIQQQRHMRGTTGSPHLGDQRCERMRVHQRRGQRAILHRQSGSACRASGQRRRFGQASMRLRFCTAAPLAPLPRLSSAPRAGPGVPHRWQRQRPRAGGGVERLGSRKAPSRSAAVSLSGRTPMNASPA